MKISTVHSLQTKCITFLALLLALTQGAWAQSGNWTDSGNMASGYESGSGTQTDPYIIKTAGQLAYFASRVRGNNDRSAYVELGADINLNGHWWTPIGPNNGNNKPANSFEGVFDGKGFTISNMYCNWGNISTTEHNRGLFTWLTNASVRNVIIESAHFQNNSTSMNHRHMGILSGGANGNTKIENVIIRNSEITMSQNINMGNWWPAIGGMLGVVYDGPTIVNCYVDVDIDLRRMNLDKYSDQLWIGMVIGGIDDNTPLTPKNVYAAGTIRIDADRTNNCIGTIIGDPTKAAATRYEDNCLYQHTPTYGNENTAITSYFRQGTQKGFSNEFIATANDYVKTQTDLKRWAMDDGKADFENIRVKEVYNHNEKEVSYELSSNISANSIEWAIDGKAVTPAEGSNGYKITIPLSNKIRNGQVTVTVDGEQATRTFEIYPKKYSVDLYADAYAGGSGTKEDPYKISNDLQMAKLAYDVNNGSTGAKFNGAYFELTDDINLDAALWMPIGDYNYKANGDNNFRRFAGKLNGNGHAIKDMHIFWDDQDYNWSNWGLFATLKGVSVNESGMCSVTNLIFDGATMEKRPDVTPYIQGINGGLLVGEMHAFTEVSNIIIKNSKITDNGETYTFTWTKELYNVFGGVIGNVKYANPGIYRIFNITADVDIDLFRNANIDAAHTTIAGCIAQANVSSGINQTNNIYPTNIYVHGNAIKTKSGALNLGTITASFTPVPSDAQAASWYYVNRQTGTGSNIRNDGSQMALAAFGEGFVKQTNGYIQNNSLNDLNQWVYTEADGFNFGNTQLELTQTDVNTITATTPGHDGEELYAWYVSQDRQNWVLQKDNDGNILYSHTLTLPYTQYDRYVYAVLQDGSSSSKSILVGKLSFTVNMDGKTVPGTYVINVTNSIWQNDNSKFTITYQWKNGDDIIDGATGNSYKPTTTPDNDNISSHVVIKDKEGNILMDKDVYSATVVYLKPTDDTNTESEDQRINDSSWGYSPEKPMLTWRGAYIKLEAKASWTENVIVLMGTSAPGVTNDPTTGFSLTQNYQGKYGIYNDTQWNTTKDSPLHKKATITGKWDNVDYNGVIEVGGDCNSIALWEDTRFENVTFNRTKDQYDILFCQYYNLEMGEGVKMTNYGNSPQYGTIDGAKTASFQIFGGLNDDGRFYPQNSETNIKKMEDAFPHQEEGFSITIKSGYYSCICAGGRQATSTPGMNGMMGTPNMPIKCTINIDINTTFNDHNAPMTNGGKADYDVGIVLAGNHEGAMYGDVDINIYSGRVARVVNGTLGNNRDYSFTYGGKTYYQPYNSYMGRANILIDPANSEYAQEGESEKAINDRVIITELYGGSAGRGFDPNVRVDNPFYGYSTVTINGGTFKILPDGNSETSKINAGIYGAGAGGMNGIGDDSNPTPDTRIAFWSPDKKVMLYGDYTTAKENLIKYHCYNSETQTYTDVDPTLTNTKIVINGGEFGSERVNIDGIYAGGSGYMTQGLFTRDTAIPNKNGGNIYGKKGETVASLTINGGRFYCKNGIFAGGRGTNYYYSTNEYGGTASDYTDLGKTYGNVEMNINGGEFHTDIFGGGYGVADAKLLGTSDIKTLSNMARLYGKSTINIYGGTFYNNIYGGGDMAVVEYDGNESATNINIYNSADIRGSVFGGGNGRMKRLANNSTIDNDTWNPDIVGKVIGSTNVTTIGDSKTAPYIYGDIYGGGNLAQVGKYAFNDGSKEPVGGNTNVNLWAGNFAGQIFGGGKGMLWDENKVNTPDDDSNIRNSADIAGNTFVTLAQDQGGQIEGDDGQKVDNFSINVIWDKLWNAENKKFYVWNANTISRSEDEEVDNSLFFDENEGKFINPHNIYGGGNLACIVAGKATVTVLKGMTPFELLKTDAWKSSYTDNNNPHFYVFGGGYGANTSVANTNVTIDVEGDYGVYNAEAGDGDEQLAKPNDGSLYDNGASTLSNKKAKKAKRAQGATTLPVFDNSKGIPNFTILGVLGGGYSGIVTGDTKVTVDGNTFLHRVYGGGFGEPESTADNTTGQVQGNTEVYVQGANIYGDVFGGGAGVRPLTSTATPFLKVAEVVGTTKVEISDDAKVYGKVYGGGDIANVGEYLASKPDGYYKNNIPQSISTIDQTPASYSDNHTTACTLISYEAKGYRSFVNVIGGDVFGNVYGGGKGLKKNTTEHYHQVGRINGNTIVHIANGSNNIEANTRVADIATNSIDPNGNNVPYIWNRIYGGCAYGTVDGNTLVHIEGGMLGLNIFGGGYGDVDIKNDMTNEDSGASTDASTLDQVLGKKDTDNKGTYANILGNTKVLIDGGSWIWNKRADVNGNILTWTGVEDGKNKICENLDEFKQIVNAINSAATNDITSINDKTIDDITDEKAKAAINTITNNEDTKEFFNIKTGLFRKNLNIFGGGNRACYVGTYNNDDKPMDGTGDAVVEINHSPLADIYDDNGKMISMFDCTTLQGLCWYLCSKVTSHPQFSVFGAGYGANTKVGNAYVYARPGARVDDTGTSIEIDGKIYRYLNHRSDMQKYYAHETELWNDFLKVSKEDKMRYYGSSDGGNSDGTDNDTKTYGRYRASRWAWELGIPSFTFMEVHGGGFSGYVTGDTYVEADGQLACRNLYGAGLGAKPYGTFTKGDDYDFGSVEGDSKVFFKSGNVSNNVYGGGAGVESVRVNNDEIVDFSARAGQIVDFPNMARVNGKTKVSVFGETITYQNAIRMERTLIFGSIYGGGDVANVGKTSAKAAAKQFEHSAYSGSEESTTLVNIRGGQLFSPVFAGGRGRSAAKCADYTKLGGIYGNAFIVVDRPTIKYPYLDANWQSLNPWGDGNMKHPDDGVNENLKPYLWNRVYGGCESGTVYGNTLVAINDGHFGYNIFGGGFGSADTTYVDNKELITLTSANVTGNTNMIINGGETALTSYWRQDQRLWEAADIIDGHMYSPQYDHMTRKFKINHNIYGGGNEVCVVGETDADGNLIAGSGNTYLTITKGMLYDNTQVVSGQSDNVKFFERDEWKEVYDKPGSPHFGVFGGGFGENTLIMGDTHLNVQMQGRGSITDFDIKENEEYKHFLSGYSIMDMIGGGYNGKVAGETHIIGDGGVFCRRIFGGGFYNSVKATNVNVAAVDCHDIFGGGLMGDVEKGTNVIIGSETGRTGTTFTNKDIYIHGSIYGGNDVSGYVNVVVDRNGYFADNGGNGTNIKIYGGNIFGNVYGAGNGDYLYAPDREGHSKVTVNEYYPLNPNDPNSEKEPLVYTVPMRENMPSYKAASDAAKIVNINSWRPMTNKVNISIKGATEDDGVIIKGDVYGGGNSATVQKVQSGSSTRAPETVGDIKLNIGNHVNIGRVFMGCNGDALFTASEDNDFMNKFQKLNGDWEDFSKELNLADTIDWMNDPSNKGISTLWLSTNNSERPLVYPHLLDLYFQPVETDIQGKLLWNGTEEGTDLTDCVIGTFCCGGNRGNMNVYPLTSIQDSEKAGNVFEYTFPAGLTITDKIVGGCNNANYNYKGRVSHEGGYLLGEIHTKYPFIKLNIRNNFKPTENDDAYKGGNVYGGCYKSGTIRGDVSVVLESDMLKDKSRTKLEKSNELLGTNAEYSTLNVYGAGYGMESYVYGNCYVKAGKGIECLAPSVVNDIFQPSGTSANFIYGGGQQGNVIGKTDVKILNGHIFKSVTGGSYSGYVWGSTQIRVGFPKYYSVNPGCGGRFTLNRTDQNNKDIDNDVNVASSTIKQEINIINDDIITQGVYDAISERYDFEAKKSNKLTAEQKAELFLPTGPDTPSVGWDKVNIVIGEAVYGGGYSLAQGGSVMANNTTVLKYDSEHNLNAGFDTDSENEVLMKNLGGTTVGFGGNTTVLIGDRTAAANDGTEDRDHITISRQDMKVANVADGQDLLGYYWKDKGETDDNGNVTTPGTYHYIYQAGTYYKGGKMPDNCDGTDVYEYDNEGGIFGDGHLSYAEGFRSADLTGYGFAGTTVSTPKILNTFQRMDILRLTDNCFSLLGARDYATNAMDKTPYSISRLGEIQMYANNVTTNGEDLGSTYTKRSRNYMGFANNIHYLGALYSNVSFSENWHDGEGKVGTYKTATGNEAKTYKEVKQKYIDDFYGTEGGEPANKDIEYIFEKRNDGTAKNMIGIASGYALKIQNAQEIQGNNGEITETLYYGPVYGVVEMNLIDICEDEGGGYVYADNVHKRSDDDSHAKDFLETTGNFVFPYTATQGRYIVDDCFPVGYTDEHDPDTDIPAHYWYVTGFNYHYTAHVTGYTFDSSHTQPRMFNSNNLDGIVALSGLKSEQEVKIETWKMYSAHTEGYDCDLEKRNYIDSDDVHDVEKEKVYDGYSLYVGASDALTYKEPAADGAGFAAKLSMQENASANECETLKNTLPASLPNGDAKIVFQLEDRINNTTTDYYNNHLSEPCKATLVLSAKALDDDREPVKGYVALTKLYTRNDNGEYTMVTSGKLDPNTEYFFKSGETTLYQSTNGKTFAIRNKDTGDYTEINKSDVTLGTQETYYCFLERYYTYTIDLTIDYVQGPDIEGHITIENCALPGERIRVRKNNVVVKADQAFSVNGYYWRLGKRKKVGEDWVFDTGETSDNWSKYTTSKYYDTFNQSDSKTATGLFEGSYYDKTEDFLEIPAYYFMNGYALQLGVTMNVPGLDDILPVTMIEADTLAVHNYQRMNPHKTGLNLHLAEAIKRAATEEDFAEPRIYLSDQSDLTAFIQFVDSIGKDSDAPHYGEHAQFILQNDLTMEAAAHDAASISDFAGTFHGNGHVINGLASGSSLFNNISGNVYNLGLSSGKISNMKAAGGKIAPYHCCYEYDSNKPIVYRMDGTLIDTYTAEDFRLGKVAYDLNEYYLRARYSNETEEDKLALKYIYDYYANGDYQYAHRTDAITGRTTGVTYLRTGRDSDLPNYEQAETRHDRTHAIDKSRAQDYVAATETAKESRKGDYLPLFNDNKNGTELMNDFLFWGQSLQSTPADYPVEISSHQLKSMANRVYRTAGYYGDTKLSVFHYNAINSQSSKMDTYVHIPSTTAIDFTCQNDLPKAIGMNSGIYYPPVSDNATEFNGFLTKDGVTKNLLVYTAGDNIDASNEAYDVVSKALGYDERTSEALISGHHMAENGDNGFTTALLHLVERDANGLNSEGYACNNNNLCVPIPFTVTNHAWYTRRPLYYANDNTGSWEGICLPFTVHKTVASLNGEITHFYGMPSETEVDDPSTNTHTLHHEYWLRGIMSVGDENGKPAATFQRPGNMEQKSKLFVPVDADGNSLSESMAYTFNNPFFVDTYGRRLYNKDANPFYAEEHVYNDYLLQTANVPYIVRFPGERYYEFDLSNAFYNNLLNQREAAQTVTFNAYDADGAISIPVTTHMSTAVNGYSHIGTFMETKVAEGSVYGMNASGTAFDDASTLSSVMPFRTYMAKNASGAKTHSMYGSAILISEPADIDKITPDLTPDGDEDGDNANSLIIRPIGENRVRIESTDAMTLNVYTTAGQLYKILDVHPGTAVYDGFQSGAYIFGKTKVMVRK